jgi:hypothetical protein
MTQKPLRSALALTLLVLAAAPARAEDLNVRIVRLLEKGGACTIGELWVNGQPMGYTLELPWKWNEQNVSAIPAGSYSGHLRYDKDDHWRIQLNDVQGRSGVQIHIGNVPREIQGCVLVGKAWDGKSCSITDSAGAYGEMKKVFYGTENPRETPRKSISVVIELARNIRSEP